MWLFKEILKTCQCKEANFQRSLARPQRESRKSRSGDDGKRSHFLQSASVADQPIIARKLEEKGREASERGKKEEKKGMVEVLKISTDSIQVVQGHGATSAIVFKRRQIPNRARGPDRRIGVQI